jgi:hypothetical protein
MLAEAATAVTSPAQIHASFLSKNESVVAENPRDLARILLRASGQQCAKNDARVVTLMNLLAESIQGCKIKTTVMSRNSTRYTPQP